MKGIEILAINIRRIYFEKGNLECLLEKVQKPLKVMLKANL